MQYAETLKDTITEKLKIQNDKKQKEGYFAVLIQKIIDNLQIDVRDIHIRLESNKAPIDHLSLGFTLDQINVFTCDEHWKPKF